MRLLTTTVLFFAVGCVGTIGDGQNPGDDDGSGSNPAPTAGRTAFKSDVHPVLGKCSGGGCHDTNGVSGTLSRFYNTDADVSYDAIVQSPLVVGQFASIAPILSHIAAGHKAVTYSAEEQVKITNWLSVESTERAGGGGSNTPPPPDPKILLREWSGCMSIENFTTAKMPTAWGTLAAATGQKCVNCHQNGLGILISADPTLFFNSMSQQSFFMLKFFTVDTQANKVIVNTGSFTSASKLAGHPYFNPTVNAGMTALQSFYDLTAARKTAGTCDPARLMD